MMMMTSQNTTLGKPLKFYTKWSSIYHIGFVLLGLLLSFLIHKFVEKRRELNLKLVHSSVKVDVVAMPRLTVKELKSINLSEIVEAESGGTRKAVQKTEHGSGEDFIKEKKQNFLSMLKDISKKEVKGKEVKMPGAKKGLTKQQQGELNELIAAGNKLSQGTSLTGADNQGEMTSFDLYVAKIPDIVRPHWKLPSYLLDKELQCRIRIFLSEEGKLLKAQIYNSSGEEEYDQKALQAVKSAAPFPNLSREDALRAVRGDILLGFPL